MEKTKEELLEECIEMGLPVCESDSIETLEEYLMNAYDDDLSDFEREFEIEMQKDELLRINKINPVKKVLRLLFSRGK